MSMMELELALPEIFIASLACLVLLVDLYISEKRRALVHFLSVLGLIFAAIITGTNLMPAGEKIYAFHDTFVRDMMGDVLKQISFLILAVVLVYSKHYLREFKLFRGEFYSLSLFALLGVMVLISAASMLTIYLGLELISLSSYALVAMNRDSARSSEAAMKYFVLGSLASGLLLYGMSMIYGVTGTLELAQIASRVPWTDSLLATFGLVFIVIGIGFKLGAVPFHMWVPDVYHGSPAAVTLLISSLPKLAAFAMAFRLLENGLGPLQEHWQGMLIVLAALSIIVGNLVAIAQTNLKRMLAYSTISHMGFMLLGLLAGDADGYAAAMYYAIVYTLMSAGAFGVLILLSKAGVEAEELEDFKGLNQSSAWFAFVMLMLMMSMAGVPVFVGFFAKWLVIQAAIDAGLIWLAILAVVFSVIGAFYYLRVVKLMYFDDPTNDQPITAPMDLRAILSLNGASMLLLGILPNALMAVCVASFS
ncbi:MAG: NADH-quinone oxidoreductase subunit NuoN [Wenzhouxiangellaceae bacterium]